MVKANTPGSASRFGNPKAVVVPKAFGIGRYTHKVAISNYRINAIDDTTVTFFYKDYKDEAKTKLMTLSHLEFVRRFAQHVLPKRLVRIRHYGILSSTWKRGKLADLQLKLWKENLPTQPFKCPKVRRCPCCIQAIYELY